MHDALERMRCALILANSDLTRTVALDVATNADSMSTSCALAKDWHIEINASIRDPGLLTDEERCAIQFTYCNVHTAEMSAKLCSFLLCEHDEALNDSDLARFKSLLVYACYASILTIVQRGKPLTHDNVSRLLSVSRRTYFRKWRNKYEWATNYLNALDMRAVGTLANRHIDASFMKAC